MSAGKGDKKSRGPKRSVPWLGMLVAFALGTACYVPCLDGEFLFDDTGMVSPSFGQQNHTCIIA
jgi:hypothetical protein